MTPSPHSKDIKQKLAELRARKAKFEAGSAETQIFQRLTLTKDPIYRTNVSDIAYYETLQKELA